MYTRVSSKELLVPPELETANCSRAVEWTEGVHAHHGILHSSERKEVTTACGPWLHDSLLLRLQDQQSARLMTVCFLMTTVTHPEHLHILEKNELNTYWVCCVLTEMGADTKKTGGKKVCMRNNQTPAARPTSCPNRTSQATGHGTREMLKCQLSREVHTAEGRGETYRRFCKRSGH